MEILILIMSIICFINSLWFLIANLTGNLILQAMFKIGAVLGTMLPIIYWLKLASII